MSRKTPPKVRAADDRQPKPNLYNQSYNIHDLPLQSRLLQAQSTPSDLVLNIPQFDLDVAMKALLKRLRNMNNKHNKYCRG